MSNVLLALIIFVISFTEEAMSVTRTQAIVAKNRIRSANRAASFDFVLFLDVYIIYKGGFWMCLPICSGSWLANFIFVGRSK